MKTVFDDFSKVVITGGSSGIGKACVEGIFGLNPDITFCNLSRSEPKLDQPGISLVHFPCDLTQHESLQAVAKEVKRHCRKQSKPGKILLINNAGFGAYGFFPEPDLKRQTDMINLNIQACVYLTGKLLPMLKEYGGTIVNVASIAGFQATPYSSIYGASKAFLLSWSLAIGEELRPYGVHTLALCPGPTQTSFFSAAGFKERPLKKIGGQTPDAVFRALTRALARRKALTIPGWHNRLLVRLMGLLPKIWAVRIVGIVLRKLRLETVKNQST